MAGFLSSNHESGMKYNSRSACLIDVTNMGMKRYIDSVPSLLSPHLCLSITNSYA